MPSLQLEDSSKHIFGFMCLTGSEEIFAIDGQHRVEGIKKAISHRSSLVKDQQCVIFVAHRKTEQGRTRTRRLFSTLNKYAKPVSPGELVALSEDDTFAIVTRKLIDEYKHLNIGFVPLTKTANIPAKDIRCVTTVLALYDLIRTISLPPRSREKRKLEIGPPEKQRVEKIYDTTCDFWNLLRKFVPAIKKVTNSQPDEELARKYRTKKGGHILFRPVGMKAFGRATRILVDRGARLEDAVSLLSRTTLDLNTAPWPGVLWNTVAKTMINKNGKLAYNLFLYMARQQIDPNNYDLLDEYRRALDMSQADLSAIERVD